MSQWKIVKGRTTPRNFDEKIKTVSAVGGSVEVSSSALPTGAATSANQTNGNQIVKGNKTPSDAFANPTDAVNSESFLMGYNGVTWDRLRTDTTNGLDVDVTRSALPTGASTASNQTDGSQKTQLVDALGNVSHSTQDINGAWHTGVHLIQHTLTSSANSSTSNLASSATFTGTATASTGGSAINVTLKTDQDCTVYIEQSTDGTNWDISDEFNYFTAIDNFSQTVKAIAQYFRTRVTNNGSSTTTYLRLQTSLCPISEPLPRSLDENGHLKVAVHVLQDDYGFKAEYSPNGETRSVIPTVLSGSAFDGTTLDTNFWTSTVANGGTNTVGSGVLLVETNTTANGSAKVHSVGRARYIPGQSNVYRGVIQANNTGVANNIRRWGMAWGATMPTITDGAYFILNGTSFGVATLKGSVETIVATGNFNGNIGSSYTFDTNAHIFEIYFNNRNVYFSVESELLHTVDASSATWSNNLQQHIYAESTNSSGITSDNTLSIRSMGIRRLGNSLSQPVYKYQSGTTAGLVCKYGVGNLHGIAISNVTNNAAITLYDNTAASGTVIWTSGPMSNQTVPFFIDFKGSPFYNGLTLVIATAACDVKLDYE